ncbi:Pycsar system effector family protein [Xanthomonas sp. SI]|uniref:Pycsar system effector family protein n=1 Tax=Xanthomonas sp. SI TaxID=2724123 RepID=UPI001C8D08F2|nr:Pycsar system effector family protein [Xanthomonas sp. SI]
MQELQNTGCHQPNQSDRVNAAWQQLQLVLGFFSRVDTKLSVGLGINLGMLAMIATRLPKVDELTLLISVIGVLFLAPLTVSFWHLWWGYFPDMRGGSDSLIYFVRIARLSESDFIAACSKRTLSEFESDILGQCWRNSKVLSLKFQSLKYSYRATVVAIAPWMALITVLPPPPK